MWKFTIIKICPIPLQVKKIPTSEQFLKIEVFKIFKSNHTISVSLSHIIENLFLVLYMQRVIFTGIRQLFYYIEITGSSCL